MSLGVTASPVGARCGAPVAVGDSWAWAPGLGRYQIEQRTVSAAQRAKARVRLCRRLLTERAHNQS